MLARSFLSELEACSLILMTAALASSLAALFYFSVFRLVVFVSPFIVSLPTNLLS